MISKYLEKHVKFIIKNAKLVLAVTLVLTCLFGFFMSKLDLDTDLIALLPEQFESVQNLKKLSSKFGGIGYLIIAIENENLPAAKRFAKDFAREIEKKKDIRYVDYRIPIEYFEDRSLLYMDAPDLRTIHKRLNKKIKLEKKLANPFYIDLLGEKYVLDFSDIENKYKNNKNSNQDLNEYYISKDKKMLVMLVKPKGLSADLGYSRKLIRSIKKIEKKLSPKKYHPSLHIGYTGRYKKKLDENKIISNDLYTTSIVALILVIALILIYFRKWAAIVLIGIPLVIGIIWTFGLSYLFIGHINIITGFLIAILLGLGIDFGIHFLIRYYTERFDGKKKEKALSIMLSQTGRATFTAATTTAAAFFILIGARFKGFSEFGLIAGLGILLSFISMSTVMPALIVFLEDLGWHKIKKSKKKIDKKKPSIFKFSYAIIFIGLFMTVFSLFFSNKLKFEYDFAELQAKNIKSFTLEKKISKVFDLSLTPSVAIAKNIKDEVLIYNAFEKSRKKKGSTIDFVNTLYRYIPKNQNQKLFILKKLYKLLQDESLKTIKGKEKKDLDRLRKMSRVKRITRTGLPYEIRRTFLGLNEKNKEIFLLIFPNVSLADGKSIRRYANEIVGISLPGNKKISASGESIIFNDILNLIESDGLIVIICIAIVVFLLILIDLKNIFSTILVLFPLFLGISWMFGIMYIFNIKFNFLNVIVLPIIIGIGIDNGVHIFHRYKEEGKGYIPFVVNHTGKAIFMASLTTMIGFSALLWASHRGLNSVGQLALFGIASTFIVAVTVLPAILQILEYWKKRQNKKLR